MIGWSYDQNNLYGTSWKQMPRQNWYGNRIYAYKSLILLCSVFSIWFFCFFHSLKIPLLVASYRWCEIFLNREHKRNTKWEKNGINNKRFRIIQWDLDRERSMHIAHWTLDCIYIYFPPVCFTCKYRRLLDETNQLNRFVKMWKIFCTPVTMSMNRMLVTNRNILFRGCHRIIELKSSCHNQFESGCDSEQSTSKRRSNWITLQALHCIASRIAQALCMTKSHQQIGLLTLLDRHNKWQCTDIFHLAHGSQTWSLRVVAFFLFCSVHFPSFFASVAIEMVKKCNEQIKCWNKRTQIYDIKEDVPRITTQMTFEGIVKKGIKIKINEIRFRNGKNSQQLQWRRKNGFCSQWHRIQYSTENVENICNGWCVNLIIITIIIAWWIELWMGVKWTVLSSNSLANQ